MSIRVNVDNFRAAESARMFMNFIAMAGGSNAWAHFRAPTPVEHQPVIRMNRDTLYSANVVDISQGATLTLPDAKGRYVSAMVVNAEHYINDVYRTPGEHQLTVADHGTEFVCLVVRTFVDPADPADVAAVSALQDQYQLTSVGGRAFQPPEYDEASMTATRESLLALAGGVDGTDRMFGSPKHVEPMRHLLGTAAGWGGLPETEAFYVMATDPRPAGRYTMTLKDVPVDAFWSLSVYNKDGFFEPNPYNSYSLNSVTSHKEADGSVILNFAPDGAGLTNHLYVMDGWNYVLRLYRPGPSVLDHSWTAPKPQPAG